MVFGKSLVLCFKYFWESVWGKRDIVHFLENHGKKLDKERYIRIMAGTIGKLERFFDLELGKNGNSW